MRQLSDDEVSEAHDDLPESPLPVDMDEDIDILEWRERVAEDIGNLQFSRSAATIAGIL